MEELKVDVVDGILNKYDNNKSYLIAILQEIQNEYKYLPEDKLNFVAERLEINLSKIFSVATFYENFSLVPKGKYIIKVCDGTACHVRKSIPILNALRKDLALSESKHTTDDMLFTVETVSCLGACGLAPVITINDKVYSKMTPESAIEIIKTLRSEE
ncbi:NADH:ubiquinone oxidoreductase subunit E [Ruminiclostridium sufflavum DSM 19573]|uniref:NADH:ubiquinone oxidoreductase subunit E n=1 Tax=Ruminiclostridium sufflavum DSM 19573 TaxID=1121337 RepID=A0A318XH26_9FIRM|nr:NAD(P)H-dependent oxidoreductase subunit E [Ruminiclostridium sufflavum]PYG85860.1 NADH:ubiquinone oxidoreductase subunit E [Ruminiclostridium sufflavum DSM 19573]